MTGRASIAERTASGTNKALIHLIAGLGIMWFADHVLWSVRPGAGVAALALVCGIVAIAGSSAVLHRQFAAHAILIVAVLPVIVAVQPLSIGLLAVGIACLVVILNGRPLRALGQLPHALPRALASDMAWLGRKAGRARLAPPRPLELVRRWAMPVGLGLVFALLLIAANPVAEGWLDPFSRWRLEALPAGQRQLLWAGAALLAWLSLRQTAIAAALGTPAGRRATVRTATPGRGGIFNAESVARALVLFNLMFAVQTGLDLAYLWGGATLPEGMSYAEYAHRGAYPLLITALLAGLFGILVQPWLGDRAGLSALLYLWIAQNVALVLSSILRLDLYVGAYGLTGLRVAAFVWMGLVAAGLLLMVVQLVGRRSLGWLFTGVGGLAIATLYLCAFVNFGGLIARHNLSRPELPLDAVYNCLLGEGAAPAILAFEARHGRQLCPGPATIISEPLDWREWGYRNWRLRRSLAEAAPLPAAAQVEIGR